MRLASRSRRASADTIGLLLAALLSSTPAVAGWKLETVDTSGAGTFTSIKVDRNGNAHVAYVPEDDKHPLKYAFWDHALDKWFTMTVANGGSFCTLALDSKQHPHISYADFGTGRGAKLRHAFWTGQEWNIEPVSPRSDAVVAYYTSIALDSQDRPVFSYYDYGDPSGSFRLWLRSVFWSGSFWGVRMVDQSQGSGKFNSVAIDSQGRPHIAYANVRYESSGLRYAKWNGSSWDTEIIEGAAAPTPIYSVAMVLDKQDNAHIAYTNVEKNLVKYATRRNGTWQLQVIDSVRKAAYPDRNGIVLDDQGDVYLSYYDEGEGSLKLAYRRNARWYAEVLARGTAGFTSSLAIHDGTLWVAYADMAEGNLKVARRPLTEFPPRGPESAVSAAKAGAR